MTRIGHVALAGDDVLLHYRVRQVMTQSGDCGEECVYRLTDGCFALDCGRRSEPELRMGRQVGEKCLGVHAIDGIEKTCDGGALRGGVVHGNPPAFLVRRNRHIRDGEGQR